MPRAWSLLVVLGLLVSLPVAARAAVTPDAPPEDWSQVAEYRIVPGDQLALNFGPLSSGVDLVRNVRVRPDGRISVYPVGDVVAAGLTPTELQSRLVQLLAGELKQPRVTVEVTQMAGNQVHVLGRVKKPGSVEVGPYSTLLQVVSAAGGFEDDAARNSVLVFHRVGRGDVRVQRIKVGRLLRGEADVPLARFDIVYVPRSSIGNVDVFVRQFFGEPSAALNFAFLGWELFNLDRVFVLRGTGSP